MQAMVTRGLASLLAVGMLLAGSGCSTGNAPTKMAGQAAATPATQPGGYAIASTQPASSQPTIMKVPIVKVSYSYGLQIGQGLKRQEMGLNADAMCLGLRDGLTGAPPQLTPGEVREAVTALQTEFRLKQRSMPVRALQNKREANEFLAKNKNEPGVITLPSGVQYKVLTPGYGLKPTVNDVVECHYRGTLIDGTEFDSSDVGHEKDDPNPSVSLVKLSDTVPGFREALQLMPVGAKWQIFIPPDLGYSGRGHGQVVGPEELLIFEVELLAIKEVSPEAR